MLTTVSSSSAVLNYENVVDAGSESDEDDKLLVSEEEHGLLNGERVEGSPASVPNMEASPRAGQAPVMKEEEDEEDARDGRADHVWHNGDALRVPLDANGEWQLPGIWGLPPSIIHQSALWRDFVF